MPSRIPLHRLTNTTSSPIPRCSSPSRYNWASGSWPAVNGDKGLPPTGLHEKDESHCTTGAIGCRGWGPEFTHIPLTNLTKVESGLGVRNWFSSEGGTVVMSSFESMAPTLAKEHWSLHGGAPPDNCAAGGSFGHSCTGSNVMAQRNYVRVMAQQQQPRSADSPRAHPMPLLIAPAV